MSKLLKQSSTAQPLLFLLVQSGDHISGLTGATPTVTLSKNGGAFASPAGAVTEIANGWYKVAGNATDTGTLGPLILHATASGADPTDERYDVVAFDPQSATNLGLTNLDAAVTSRGTYSGGAITGNITGNLSGSVGSVTGAVGSVTGNVGGSVASVTAAVSTTANSTETAIKAKTDLIPASPAAVADVPTPNAVADALLDRANGVETGLTPRGALRLIAASAAGKLSGAAGTTVAIRNAVADSKDRITATVDASGNRSAVTTDLT